MAVAAWKLRRIRGDSQYFGHLHDLISQAYDEGAEIIVLPELHVMELLPLAGEIKEEFAARYLVQYADALESWLARIAASSGLTIVGGSHFRQVQDRIQNVCAVATPAGEIYHAAKNKLTAYEREVWRLEGGFGLRRFRPGVGVTVCYDSEFPESGRTLAEAGTWVQCIPAWTETRYGFQRVRWSAQARAVENQVFAVHASLVGDLGAEPVPSSYGSSAILTPSMPPFPESAVLAETPLNEEGVVMATLDLEALHTVRQGGEVRNWQDRSGATWSLLEDAETRNPLNSNGELN